jgi:hypothetical protein
MNHVFYSRHFALLAGFSVLICVMSSLHLSGTIFRSIAVYGALHASALVCSLRSRTSIRRKCSFIAVAALLSILAGRVGISAGQLAGTGPASVNVYWLLAFSAAAGAVPYGVSVRIVGFYALSVPALAAIAVACVMATCIAGFTVRHIHFLGVWWLAVAWWHAFSAGLWYFDERHIQGL